MYDEIVNNETNDWLFYKSKYQPHLNSLRTKFRLYMDVEWETFKNNK